MSSRGLSGRRVVVGVYIGIVALTGVMGYVIAWAAPELTSPALFGILSLPATPAGVAVFGMVTIGTGLGVLLGLVMYVSANYVEDDA